MVWREVLVPRRVSVWGATGSIGCQALEVMGRYGEAFDVVTLTTHRRADFLFEQAKRFCPERVVITGDVERGAWEKAFGKLGVTVGWGREELLDAASRADTDLVVNALVGGVGLEATLRTIEAGVSVALANKETLVMAGEIVSSAAKEREVSILPVDSEHSAIFQCLQGEDVGSIRRLLLTASGGPFLGRDRSALDRVTVEEALAHPNWSMGKKVSIDSATLMNKGLEVIEAHWFFGIEPERIEVVIHPQSIVHSMVEFVDGSIKAQLGVPDMRVPISYALTYPERWSGGYGWLDFAQTTNLGFSPPDMEKWPALRLAYEALEMGGTAPAVLNAADEVAVDLFLTGQIGFLQIPWIIAEALERHEVVSNPGLDGILRADGWTREIVLNEILSHLRG